MLGAIVGDIVGSPYEFFNEYSRRRIVPFKRTVRGRCQFTDDSALTMAVAKALINNREENDVALGEKVACALIEYYNKYPLKKPAPINSCYGNGFMSWIEAGDISKKRVAETNGGVMRIAPVGWLYSTMTDTLRVAKLVTERTHNSSKAIRAAQMVAAAIFLARRVKNKCVIRRYAEQVYGYHVLEGERALNQLRERSKRYRANKMRKLQFGDIIDCDASVAVEHALFAFLNTSSFKECVITAIAIGGDSDTIACIAGGIAEAYYGVPKDWKYQACKVLVECKCQEMDIDMVMNFNKYAAPIIEGWEDELPDGIL